MTKKAIILSLVTGISLAATGAAVAQKGPGRADTNGDGIITKEEVLASVKTRFAKMDANGDGKVSADEIEAGKTEHKAKRFAQIDTDNNGSISQQELEAAKERRGGKGRADRAGGERRGPDGAKGRGGRAAGGLEAIDSDGDNAISFAEMEAQALKRFERADANKDGQITAEERKAARENRPAGGKGRGGRRGAGANDG